MASLRGSSEQLCGDVLRAFAQLDTPIEGYQLFAAVLGQLMLLVTIYLFREEISRALRPIWNLLMGEEGIEDNFVTETPPPHTQSQPRRTHTKPIRRPRRTHTYSRSRSLSRST